MRRAALAFALIALAGAAGPGTAIAGPDSSGTDFWLGFPYAEPGIGTPSYELLISAQTAATGTASIPGTAFSQAFTVAPGAVTAVTLPATVEDGAVDTTATGHGVHLTADHAIAVHALYFNPGLSDGYLGLSTPALGTSYRVMDYPGNALCGKPEFEIVGTQPGTTVTINPSQPLVGHVAGVPYVILLDAGSTYLGQASSTTPTTGTKITADQPIAVLGGTSCAQIPAGASAANDIVEEMPPIAAWGTDFSVEPFAGRTSGDQLTLLGSAEETPLTVTTAAGTPGGAPTSLNAGQAATFSVDESTRITAGKPILVAHFAESYEADTPSPLGDPTMVLVPPREHYAYAQTVSTPATGFTSRYLNVTIPTADLGSLKLDGAAVPGASFAPVGGDAAMSGAQLPVSAGVHTLTDDGPFGVEAYGFDPGSGADAFGWPGAWGDGSRAPVAAPPTPPQGGSKAKLPPFSKVVLLPSTKRCLSGGALTIRLRTPKGTKIVKLVVSVNGKKTTVKGRKLTRPIHLRHLPRGKIKVRITVTLADHRVIKGSRTYRTCGKRSR